jgi:hypothetical protein
MRFFFYGTLQDQDVMALVLGRRLPPWAFRAAVLPGHARRRVKGASYPIVVRDSCGEVGGVVVSGLSARDVARLSAYEGPRYRVASVKVRTAGAFMTVSIFEPVENRFQPTSGDWDLAVWQRDSKRMFVERLRRAFNARPAYSTR